jgi:hypothetical protein
MKFFTPLGFRYGTDKDLYSHVGVVFGPYENDDAVEKTLAQLYPNDKGEQFLVFEGQIVNVKPSVKEKPEEEKRAPGNMDNYVKNVDGYKCKDCGGLIIGSKVAHPIQLREMPGAGSGECEYEIVPYCPNCEKKPDFHGAPVIISIND